MRYRRNLAAAFAASVLINLLAVAALGSPLSFYGNQGIAKNLHLAPEWLGLIHYEKKLFGGYESKMHGNDFFLSPHGPTSPQDELAATLEKFFAGPLPDRQKYQCGFLARRDFLVRELAIESGDILPCPEFDDWIQRLNPQAVTLVYASGSLGSPASNFGHIFLQFETSTSGESRGLLNYAVNYAARTQDTGGVLYAYYGLFGFFPGTYGMAPYHHLIKAYTNLEGRDLWEYRLDLTPSEVQHLVKHLLELEKGYFDYYFLDGNCASMIATALDVARPELHLSRDEDFWVLPMDVVKRVSRSGLVKDRKYRASLASQFESSYERLTTEERRDLKRLKQAFEKDPAPSANLANMSTLELEAAQNYFGLEGAFDFQKYREINYALSRARSKRDQTARAAPNSEPLPPELGQDPSRFAVARIVDANINQTEFTYRAVGNDLLGSDTGLTPFSEFSLVDIDLASQGWKSTELRSLTIVHLLSTHAVRWIDAPLSWGFSLDWQEGWMVPLRAGYSFDCDLFSGTRWMDFLVAKLQEQSHGRSAIIPGFQSLLPIHLNSTWRILIGEELDLDHSNWHWLFTGGVAWQIERDFEVRLEKNDESKISFNAYF